MICGMKAAAPLVLAGTSLLVLAAIVTDALPWLRGPAPYPPEWRWAGRPGGPAGSLMPATAVAIAILGLIALSEAWRRRLGPRWAARALLIAVSVGGLGIGIALLGRDSPDPLWAMRQRAKSFSITSYHTLAVSDEARDPRAFLEAHAALLPVLVARAPHAATHPPGPVLWYRAALALCEWSPRLTGALLSVSAAPVPEEQRNEVRAGRASALLGALGLAVLSVLTVWPLARLGEGLGLAPVAAARTAAVLTLLPGPALFAGSLDAALALPAAAAATWLLDALRSPSRAGAGAAAIAAGVCERVALFGSYGAGAFLAVACLAVVAAEGGDRCPPGRAAAISLGAATVAALLAFGLPSLLGHDPLRALRTALALHRTEYTAPRGYALWLAFNPLDFALFAGLPVALVALGRARESLRRAGRRRSDPLDRFRIVTLAGIALLVASGLTRGEVGRIWIPLVPLLLLASATTDEDASPVEGLLPATLGAAFTLAIGGSWSV